MITRARRTPSGAGRSLLTLLALGLALGPAACASSPGGEGGSAPGTGDGTGADVTPGEDAAGGDSTGAPAPSSDASADGAMGPGTDDVPPTGPTCTSEADCTEPDEPCRVQGCDLDAGVCVWLERPDQTPCDDADSCSEDTVCLAGVCDGGLSRVCDDHNPCTTDGCEPDSGCVFADNVSPCDDGNTCTEKDTCAAGTCTGTPTAGCACSEDVDCAEHEDGDLCNGTLICAEGSCVLDSGSVVSCPTVDSPCVTYGCDASTGTCEEAVVDGASCSDGDPCTSADTCSGGGCVGTAVTCPCSDDADCAVFEDGNACNGTLTCMAGDCVLDPTTVVTCDTSADSACSATACAPDSGACETTEAPAGTPCDDGDACTAGDACLGGACWASAIACDDGNVCTLDTCDPVSGCVFSNTDNVPCTDGEPCTSGDVCTGGSCIGLPIACDDGKDCTDDVCSAGTCVHTETAPGSCGCELDSECDDGNQCTLDHCEAWECQWVSIAGCCNEDWECPGDGECTVGACDNGSCVVVPSEPLPCDDGDPCTTADHCVDGECKAGPPVPDCCPPGETCGPDCGDGTCSPGETCGTCGSDCGPCTGDCCLPHGTPGCEDAATTACVCAVDDFCCTLAWDAACINKAADCGTCPECGDGLCEPYETCETCQVDCGSCEGSCCATHPSPGCVDPAIQSCVCDDDPFCCEGGWDDGCVALADECGAKCPLACGDGLCDDAESCESCPSDCAPCDECGDGFCEPGVESCAACPEDCGPCTTCGDGLCGEQETCGTCPDDCDECDGDCCKVQDGPGCGDKEIQACVCDVDAFCCEAFWDAFCIEQADLECEADCKPDGPGDDVSDCCHPHPTVGCDDAAVEDCVCEGDPFCCEVEWDELCADDAVSECEAECEVNGAP